jgi:uncharacterized protein (TIGR03067 family)
MPRGPPPFIVAELSMKRLVTLGLLVFTLCGCTRPGVNLYADLDKVAPNKATAPGLTDMERIQGIWTFAGLEQEGAPVTKGRHYEQAREMKWAFQGDCFHNTAPALKVDGTFTIDPSQRPAILDVFLKNGDKTMTVRMLYQLQGDCLRLCYDLVPDSARPKTFAAADSNVILTLRREIQPTNETAKVESQEAAGK